MSKQEKLLELADRIDSEKLWRQPAMDRDKLTPEQRDRLDAGVMLRRYADLLEPDRWIIFPPTGAVRFSAATLDKVCEMAKRNETRKSGVAHAASTQSSQVAQGELPEPKLKWRHADICGNEIAPFDPFYSADQMRAYGKACAEAARQPAPALTDEQRKTLEYIAGWMDSSVRIVQNAPDDYGPATQFDYDMGQAAHEIFAILKATQKGA